MSDDQTQLPDSENPHAAEFAVLQALQAEIDSLKDQRLRALAEAENIRRRAEREKHSPEARSRSFHSPQPRCAAREC